MWTRAPSQPPDAITAFAVPNPSHSSQNSRFFRVWLPDRLPCQTDHSTYFGLASLFEPILSIIDAKDPSPHLRALSMPVISAVSNLFNTASQS